MKKYLWRTPSMANHGRSLKEVMKCTTIDDVFSIVQKVGDGTFGSVHLATRKDSTKVVAIKSMKKKLVKISDAARLREVHSLLHLSEHENIVNIFDLYIDQPFCLHIVMEFLECNLFQLINSRRGKPFSYNTVRDIMSQIFQGIGHIHANGFFHRDMKPENILVSPVENSDAYKVKIADFGLAREIHSSPPYTEYVSTRWYRAPELLLRDSCYSCPVDIYAAGCMAFEVATLQPIFPGMDDVDQLYKICEILGSPDEESQNMGFGGGGTWKQAEKLTRELGIILPRLAPLNLRELFSSPWNGAFASMLTELLQWNPDVRPNARKCLELDFFSAEEVKVEKPTEVKTKQVGKVSEAQVSIPTYSFQNIFTKVTLPYVADKTGTRSSKLYQKFHKGITGFKRTFQKSNKQKKGTKTPQPISTPVDRPPSPFFPVLPQIRPSTPLNLKLRNYMLSSAEYNATNKSMPMFMETSQSAGLSQLNDKENRQIRRKSTDASSLKHFTSGARKSVPSYSDVETISPTTLNDKSATLRSSKFSGLSNGSSRSTAQTYSVLLDSADWEQTSLWEKSSLKGNSDAQVTKRSLKSFKGEEADEKGENDSKPDLGLRKSSILSSNILEHDFPDFGVTSLADTLGVPGLPTRSDSHVTSQTIS
ncbi:serine/threonine protein kinase, meiotic, STKc MAK-like Pit1 [Schizosaccharomyces osmophilus]|uniref:Serine/threonine protein kinase, meiotic, STKc MAK-like Pit1 n=1 Tax=Schizosaccharomyces osmophilus TaxID=2545709 RepID=A0AAE9WCG2_9SCHI|nr:serine/threonine protein kinase, meiotic, STKc MAK-like Pit1 [Schizosaccharomyces osmophilus]WBW73709.1 serine/threonine protein kinase, meiotic, STKc MAK-like Pit1 [Schizosaccharomyces osmophilus]